MATSKVNYGIDAPTTVRNLTIGGILGVLAGFGFYSIIGCIPPIARIILLISGFVAGFALLATAGLLVWSSKYGKLREREHLIDALGLVGNEKVLDVGCGRGLLLNGVARRLPKGMAFGIDLWQTVDQSGNSPEAALANSKAENVADRVEIRTADMRDLPFSDGSMDAVISSLAIHNVPDGDGRAKAIREITRVLKPKGRLALQDIHCIDEYIKTLKDLGWRDVKLSGLNFMIFPPIRIVTGQKP
ncbi:MAG: class I SAM-dependent methyltransferase [Syntrophobacteraceae bacterium]